MATRIRLARGGSKKRPYYHVVIADIRAPRDGRFIERIGHYNPLLAKDDEQRFQVNEERVKHWLAVGATPTDRVARYLSHVGLVDWQKSHNPNKAKPGAKAQERLEEQKAKEDAKAAATAEAEAVRDDTPAEGAPEVTPETTPEDAPAG